MQLLISLIALFPWLGGQAPQAASHLVALPPTPHQDAIICQNATWEAQNLLAVDGQVVHKKLQPYVLAMFTDAKQDGHTLSVTSAYRTCDQQKSLRIQNCGSSQYDLTLKPINQCTVPTEPAGHSLHNAGLAVDLACSGYGQFEGSPCYQWVRKHGQKYRLFEHKLEPWHWSTTGQ